MSKNTKDPCENEATPSPDSPRQKPPRLAKPSVSVIEVEKSPNSAKKELTNGCPKKETQGNLKHAVDHANGNFDKDYILIFTAYFKELSGSPQDQ